MKHSLLCLGVSWWVLTTLAAVSGQAQYRPGSTSAGAPGGAGGAGVGGAGGAGGVTGGSFGGLGAAADDDYDSFDDGFGGGSEGSLEETIPGIPGDDYPIFAEVPDTSFVCDGLVEGGYYADVEAECQVFHICGNDGNGGLTKYSFLCPNGTIFQQQYFVCDWWFNVDCSLAEDLYSLNDQYAAEREANIGAGGSQGGAGQGGDGVQSARGQASQAGQGNRGGQTGERGGPRGSSGQSGGRGGQDGGRGGTGGSRGSSAQSGSRPGSRRNNQSQGGGRRGGGGGGGGGAQPGYLAPSSADSLGLGADTGYGAPLGGQETFDGAGDFPLLSQYTRNTRDSEYAMESEEEIMDKEA